ncbi:hypothetical protein [Leuconostoc mesenteroides]|nr:hypothetical protein [Leuconostoc mesenteroides]
MEEYTLTLNEIKKIIRIFLMTNRCLLLMEMNSRHHHQIGKND